MAKMAKDDPEVIADNLQAQRDAAPAHLQHYFLNFEDLWERKLWHELTEALVEFYNNPESAEMRIPLFDSLCTTSNFSGKINQLKLVFIGLSAASQYSDDSQRLTFLLDLANRVDKPASQEAFVYAQVAVASVKLQKQDLDGAQKDLAQCETILDTFDSVETSVHAAFYRVYGDYYQAKQEFASYYHNALLYLACVNLSDMSHDEQQHRAYDLSIAALVSETIYNFGELLLHPILDTLKDPKHAWLRDLLFAFNAGDLGAYDILTANSEKNKLLKEHESFLHQKICLSALTEAVFRRPPHDRSMTFGTIQNETKVQMDQIEHLMMKALSLGLIRGTIDQVAQVANINWVQPKVLDMAQIESMRSRLEEWDSGVNQLGTWMEGVGKDVWAA